MSNATLILPDQSASPLTYPLRSVKIPSNINKGVRRELIAAVKRFGWTPELRQAVCVLPVILTMTPKDFQAALEECFVLMT